MPVHRVSFLDDHEDPTDALERAVKVIERKGETVAAIHMLGPSWVVVTHRAPVKQTRTTKPTETR